MEKQNPVYDHDVVNTSDQKCLMNVYTVDPRFAVHAQAQVSVAGEFSAGPRSDEAIVLGMPVQYDVTDANGNFLYDADVAPDAFDAVHCVAVVARVMHMYRRVLQRIDRPMDLLRWQWGTAPLGIRPYALEKPSASYSRSKGEILFCYTKNPQTKEDVYLCRSYDIVAHMTGHAVLDGLKPTFYGENASEEIKALHESFADLTAVFAQIVQLDVCRRMAAECGGDFTNIAAYVTQIENEDVRDMFGGQEFGLRGVKLGVKVTDVVAEHKDWSRAFTSAIFEIIVRMSAEQLHPKRGRAEALHLTGIHMCGMVLRAYLEAPFFDPSFRDLAKYILKVEPDSAVRAIMKEEFKSRKFFDKWELPKRWHGVNKMGGCTTLAEKGTLF